MAGRSDCDVETKLQQAVLTLEVTQADITPLARLVDMEEHVQTAEAALLKRRGSAGRRNSRSGLSGSNTKETAVSAEAKEAADKAASLRLMNRLLHRACDAVVVLSLGREPTTRLPSQSVSVRLAHVPAFARLHEAALLRSTGTISTDHEDKASVQARTPADEKTMANAAKASGRSRQSFTNKQYASKAAESISVFGDGTGPASRRTQGDGSANTRGGQSDETPNHRSTALSAPAGMMLNVGSAMVQLDVQHEGGEEASAPSGRAGAESAASDASSKRNRRASLSTAMLTAAAKHHDASRFGGAALLLPSQPDRSPLLGSPRASGTGSITGTSRLLRDPAAVATLRREEMLLFRTQVEAASLNPSWAQLFRVRLYSLQPDTVIQLSLFALASRSDIGEDPEMDSDEDGDDDEDDHDDNDHEQSDSESIDSHDHDDHTDDEGKLEGGRSPRQSLSARSPRSPRGLTSGAARRGRRKHAERGKKLAAQRRRRPFLLGTAVLRLGRSVFSVPSTAGPGTASASATAAATIETAGVAAKVPFQRSEASGMSKPPPLRTNLSGSSSGGGASSVGTVGEDEPSASPRPHRPAPPTSPMRSRPVPRRGDGSGSPRAPPRPTPPTTEAPNMSLGSPATRAGRAASASRVSPNAPKTGVFGGEMALDGQSRASSANAATRPGGSSSSSSSSSRSIIVPAKSAKSVDALRGWLIRPPTTMTLSQVASFLPVHRNDEPANQVFGVPSGSTGSWTVSPRETGMGHVTMNGGVTDRAPPSWALMARMMTQPAMRGRLRDWSGMVYRWAVLCRAVAVSAPQPPPEVTDPASFTLAQLQASDVYASVDGAGSGDGSPSARETLADARRWLVKGAHLASTSAQAVAVAASAAKIQSSATALLGRRLHAAALLGVEGTPLPSGAPEAWRLAHEGAPARLQEDTIGRMAPDGAGGIRVIELGEAVWEEVLEEQAKREERERALLTSGLTAEELDAADEDAISTKLRQDAGARASAYDDDDDDDDDDGGYSRASARGRAGSTGRSSAASRLRSAAGKMRSPAQRAARSRRQSGFNIGDENLDENCDTWPIELRADVTDVQRKIALLDRRILADETARGGTMGRIMGPLAKPAAAQRSKRVRRYNPGGAGSAGRLHTAAISKNEPSVTAVLPPGTVARPVFAEVDMMVVPPAALVRALRVPVQKLLVDTVRPGPRARSSLFKLARYMITHSSPSSATAGSGAGARTDLYAGAMSNAQSVSSALARSAAGLAARPANNHSAPGPAVLRLRWRLDIDADPEATRGAEALFEIGVRRGHPLTLLPNRHLAALARAVEQPKTNDIVKHLPVLKPLFRHVATLAEQRVSSTGASVFAAIKGQELRPVVPKHRAITDDPSRQSSSGGKRTASAVRSASTSSKRSGRATSASKPTGQASSTARQSQSNSRKSVGGQAKSKSKSKSISAQAEATATPTTSRGKRTGASPQPELLLDQQQKRATAKHPTFAQRVARRVMGRLRMLKMMGVVPGDTAGVIGAGLSGLVDSHSAAGTSGGVKQRKPPSGMLGLDKSKDPVRARRRRRGQPPILMTHSTGGLAEFVFVGLLQLLTVLPREALKDAFRRMDANADGELTFSELIAFLLREADVALTFKASQDSYLLEPPLADDPTSTAVVDRPGGLLAFIPLKEMQGYAMAFSDGALRVLDDELRPGLALNTAHIPSPQEAVLPFDAVPDTVAGQRIRGRKRGQRTVLALETTSAGGVRSSSGRNYSGSGRNGGSISLSGGSQRPSGVGSRAGRSIASRAASGGGVVIITKDDADAAIAREANSAADRAAKARMRAEEQQMRLEMAKAKSLRKSDAGMLKGLDPGNQSTMLRSSKTSHSRSRSQQQQQQQVVIDMDGNELTHAEVRQKARLLQLELTGQGSGEAHSSAGLDPQGEGGGAKSSFVAVGAESARTILGLVYDQRRSRLLALRADRLVLVFDLSPFRADAQTPLRELSMQSAADMTAADKRGVKEARLLALAQAAGASGKGKAVAAHSINSLVDGVGNVTGKAAIALARATGLDRGMSDSKDRDLWIGGRERWEEVRRQAQKDDSMDSDPVAFAVRIQQARKDAIVGKSDADSYPGLRNAPARSSSGVQFMRKRDRGIAPPSDSFVPGTAAEGGSTTSAAVSGAVAAALAARGQAGDTIVDSSELGRATGVGVSRLAASGRPSAGPRVRVGDGGGGDGKDDQSSTIGDLDERGLLRGTTSGGGVGAVISKAPRMGAFSLPTSVQQQDFGAYRAVGKTMAVPPARAATGHVRGDGVKAGNLGSGTELALGRAKGTAVRLAGGEELRLEGGAGEVAGTLDEADGRDVVRVITGSLETAQGAAGRVASVIVACTETFGVGPGIPTKMIVTSTDEATLTAAVGEEGVASVRPARLYAVGDSMGWVTFYDCSTLKLHSACQTVLDGVTGMVAVPGLGIAVAGHGGGVQVVDPRTATVTKRFQTAHQLGVTAIALCAGEQLLVTAGYDSKILCWDAHGSTAMPVAELSSGAPPVLRKKEPTKQSGQSGGGKPMSGLEDGLADTSSADRVIALSVAEAHAMILAVTAGGKIEVYDPKTLQLTQRLQDRLATTTRGVVVDAQRLVVGTFGSHLRLWRIREVDGNTLTAAQAALRAVAAGPASALAAAQREDRERDEAVPERRVALLDSTVSEIGISGTKPPSPRSLQAKARRGQQQTLLKKRGLAAELAAGGAGGSAGSHQLTIRSSPMRQQQQQQGRNGQGSPARLTAAVVKAAPSSGSQALTAVRSSTGLALTRRASHAEAVLGELIHTAEDLSAPTGRRPSVVQGPASFGNKSGGPPGSQQDSQGGRVSIEVQARRASAAHLEEAIESARKRLHLRRGSVEERAVRNLVSETTERAAQLRVSDADAVLSALYSPTFGVIVTVRFGGRVATWDVRTGEVRATFRVSHRHIAATGAMGGDDGSITNSVTGRSLRLGATFKPPEIELTAASLDAHGRRLLTGGIDGSVKMWSIANGDLVRSLPPVASEVSSVVFHTAVGLTRPVIAGAWSGDVAFWRDAGESALVKESDGGNGGGRTRGSGQDDEVVAVDLGLSVPDDDDGDDFPRNDAQGGSKRDREAKRASAARRAVDSAISRRAELAGIMQEDEDADLANRRTVPRWKPATGGGGSNSLLNRRVDAIKGRISLKQSHWGGAGLTDAESKGLVRHSTISTAAAQLGGDKRKGWRRRRPSVEGDQLSRDVPLSIFDEAMHGAAGASDGDDGSSGGMLPRRGAGISGRGNASSGKGSTETNLPHVEVVPLPTRISDAVMNARAPKISSISELVLTAHWAKALKRVLQAKVTTTRAERAQRNKMIELTVAKQGRSTVGGAVKPAAGSTNATSLAGLASSASSASASARSIRSLHDAMQAASAASGSASSIPKRASGGPTTGRLAAASRGSLSTGRGMFGDAPSQSGGLQKSKRPGSSSIDAAGNQVVSRPRGARTLSLQQAAGPSKGAVPGLDLTAVQGGLSNGLGGTARALGTTMAGRQRGGTRQAGGSGVGPYAGVKAVVDTTAPATLHLSSGDVSTANEDRIMDAAAVLADMMDLLVFGGTGAAARASLRAKGVMMEAGEQGPRHGDVLCVAAGGGRPVVVEDGMDEDDPRGGGSGRGFASASRESTSSHGSAWVVTGSADGQLCLWDAVTERTTSAKRVHDASGVGTLKAAAVWSLCGLEQQKLVVVGTDGGCLHVLDVVSGNLIQRIDPSRAADVDDPTPLSPSGGVAVGVSTPFGKRPTSTSKSHSGHPRTRSRGGHRRDAGDADDAEGSSDRPMSPGSLLARNRWMKAKTVVKSPNHHTTTVSESLRTGWRCLPLHEEWGPSAAHGVTAMAADALEHTMLVGYGNGWARIFDVTALAARTAKLESPLTEFLVSGAGFAVRSAAFVGLKSTQPLFVTCSGIDVSLWTRGGKHVARFGQATPWPALLSRDQHARRITRASLALGIASADEVAGAARRASNLLLQGTRRSAGGARKAAGGGHAQRGMTRGVGEAAGADNGELLHGEPLSRGARVAGRGAQMQDSGLGQSSHGGVLSTKSSQWAAMGSSRRARKRREEQQEAAMTSESALQPLDILPPSALVGLRPASPTRAMRRQKEARAAAEVAAAEASSATRVGAGRTAAILARGGGAQGAGAGTGTAESAWGPRGGAAGRRDSTSAKLDAEVETARAEIEEREQKRDEARWKTSARTAAGRQLLPSPDASLTDALAAKAERIRAIATGNANSAAASMLHSATGIESPSSSRARAGGTTAGASAVAGFSDQLRSSIHVPGSASVPSTRPRRPDQGPSARAVSSMGRTGMAATNGKPPRSGIAGPSASARRTVGSGTVRSLVAAPLGDEDERVAADRAAGRGGTGAAKPLHHSARVQREYVGAGVWRRVPVDSPLNTDALGQSDMMQGGDGAIDRLAQTLANGAAEAATVAIGRTRF